MREILFRGKRLDNGEWVEGYYKLCGFHVGTIEEEIYPTITPFNQYGYIVDPKTVGQFTGLTDKNGKKIFEGDIVIFNRGRNLPNHTPRPLRIFFDERNSQFTFCASPYATLQKDMMSECEIIGNIHDNPELMEV